MKKISIFGFCAISILIISEITYAQIFNKKLKQYQCKSSEQAHSCVSCESTDFYEKGKSIHKIEYEFKIDKEQNRVMKVVYDLGKVSSSDYLDNCKVIDSKNWICFYKGGWFTIIEKMTNGVFISINENENKKLSSNFCAK